MSRREIEILKHLSDGRSNMELAELLAITVGTTKGHLYRIFRKLDVRNRAAAVAKAREMGIF